MLNAEKCIQWSRSLYVCKCLCSFGGIGGWDDRAGEWGAEFKQLALVRQSLLAFENRLNITKVGRILECKKKEFHVKSLMKTCWNDRIKMHVGHEGARRRTRVTCCSRIPCLKTTWNQIKSLVSNSNMVSASYCCLAAEAPRGTKRVRHISCFCFFLHYFFFYRIFFLRLLFSLSSFPLFQLVIKNGVDATTLWNWTAHQIPDSISHLRYFVTAVSDRFFLPRHTKHWANSSFFPPSSSSSSLFPLAPNDVSVVKRLRSVTSGTWQKRYFAEHKKRLLTKLELAAVLLMRKAARCVGV